MTENLFKIFFSKLFQIFFSNFFKIFFSNFFSKFSKKKFQNFFLLQNPKKRVFIGVSSDYQDPRSSTTYEQRSTGPKIFFSYRYQSCVYIRDVIQSGRVDMTSVVKSSLPRPSRDSTVLRAVGIGSQDILLL